MRHEVGFFFVLKHIDIFRPLKSEGGQTYEAENPTEKKLQIAEMFKQAQVFLVDKDLIEPLRKEAEVDDTKWDAEAANYLDLPFRTVWLEYADDFYLDRDPMFDMMGTLFTEVGPGHYIVTQAMLPKPNEITSRPDKFLFVTSALYPKHPDWGGWWAIWKRISSAGICAWGEERVNERVRLTTAQGRELHKVKRVIHVRPKAAVKPTMGHHGPIDWKHRWEVRGHWRKLPEGSLGKNRDGVYDTKGATWVSAYLKGPDAMPLVKKTRIVG